MNSHIRTILDELYVLEPQLKTQENELITIIEQMLEHKPDAEPDPAFVQQLRMILKERAASTSTTHSSLFFPAPRSSRRSVVGSFLTMQSFPYAVVGAVLGAVITGPIVYSIVTSDGTISVPTDAPMPMFSYGIQEAGNQAFGDLSDPSVSINPRGQGGGGGGAPSIDAAMPTDAKMIAPDSMIYPAEITEYNFTINGEMPALTDGEVDVLKRRKGMSSPSISSILGSFDLGFINLSSFNDAKVDSISFYEDKQYGYMFYLNFREGSLSINANWEKWPQVTDYQPIDPSSVPADERLLSIASSFVSDHDINVSSYGAPEVDKQWQRQFELMSAAGTSMYAPDSVRVVYPLLIDGQPVYDEGGSKMGISIGINVRENRVSDVWGIMDQNFQKSSYPGVTDGAQVTQYLDTYGDMQKQWMPEGTTVKTVDVTLGAPIPGFTRMYVYDDANRMGNELIVPALIFPVESVPEGQYYYQTSITVPLAKELLEKINQPIGVPRPLMMEDVPTPAAQ